MVLDLDNVRQQLSEGGGKVLSLCNTGVDDVDEEYKIGDDDIALLCSQVLRGNSTLKMLYLADNQIGDSGVELLCREFLRSNSTLKVLVLNDNQIGDSGVELLCGDFLRGNSTLKVLHLHGNCFGDGGEKALVSAVGDQNSLMGLSHLTGVKLNGHADVLGQERSANDVDEDDIYNQRILLLQRKRKQAGGTKQDTAAQAEQAPFMHDCHNDCRDDYDNDHEY